MKILSIIIPSYNTERFLEKNIPTFLSDTILNDIELLIINDGSTDKTEEIATELENHYPNTIRVISKENGGHGSVINKGIELATGKYFKVVDGDDWVEDENLVQLVSYLKDSKVDLVLNPYYLVNEMKNNKKSIVRFSDVEFNVEYDFNKVINRLKTIPLHSFTIKSKILKENKIELTEKCFYDDFEYTFFPVPYISNVIFLEFPVYDYLVGQKTQSVSSQNVLKNSNMHYMIIKDSLKFYDTVINHISSEKKQFMYQAILRLIRTQYNIYIRNANIKGVYEQCKDFDKSLKVESPESYRAVGEKYQYIALIRKTGRGTFFITSVLLAIYKKVFSYGE